MCRLGKGLKSGRLPGVLYADGTAASKAMRRILDSAGAKYELGYIIDSSDPYGLYFLG